MKKAYWLDAQRRKSESERLAYSTDSGFGNDYLKRNASRVTLPETQYAARQWETDQKQSGRRINTSILSISYPADVRELLEAKENPKDGSRSVFHEYDRYLLLSRTAGKSGPMMFSRSVYNAPEDSYEGCDSSLYELLESIERARDRMETLTDLPPAQSEQLLRSFISELFGMPDYREPDCSARPLTLSPEQRRIAPQAFYCRTDVSSADLPESVAAIGKMAFAGCTRLQTVSLPGVKTLGDCAFAYCRSLKTIVLPEGIEHIPDSCFKRCTSLENIVLPESVVSIGANAFEGCTSLTRLRLPDGLKTLGADAFGGCIRLHSMTLPEDIVSVPDGAFMDCLSLRSVCMPQCLLSIGAQAFAACGKLESISLPERLESIGDQAFQSCFSLHSISLPESVVTIGKSAFSACRSLEAIHLPNRLEQIRACLFSGCAGLNTVSLPRSLKFIGAQSFSGCMELKSIALPEDVQLLDPSAFDECELHAVSLSAHHFSIPGIDELISRTDTVCCPEPIGAVPLEHQRRAFLGFAENEARYPQEVRADYLAYLHKHAAGLTAPAQAYPSLLSLLLQEGLTSEE